MQPFENGWAKRKIRDHTYGHSYLHLYENKLIQMYQEGVRNNSAKMSAGKRREKLLSMYPNRFSIPGETEIKQFIGKLTQTNKNYDLLNKSQLEVERLAMERDLGMHHFKILSIKIHLKYLKLFIVH